MAAKKLKLSNDMLHELETMVSESSSYDELMLNIGLNSWDVEAADMKLCIRQLMAQHDCSIFKTFVNRCFENNERPAAGAVDDIRKLFMYIGVLEDCEAVWRYSSAVKEMAEQVTWPPLPAQ